MLLVQFYQEYQCENATRQVLLTSDEFGDSPVRMTIPFSKASILASSTAARSLSGLLINSWRTSAVAMTADLKRAGWVNTHKNSRTIFIFIKWKTSDTLQRQSEGLSSKSTDQASENPWNHWNPREAYQWCCHVFDGQKGYVWSTSRSIKHTDWH